MRRAIEALAIHHHGPGAVVTVSAGVAQLEASDGGDFDAIARRADAGLYLSKERGRNRVELAPAVDPNASSQGNLRANGRPAKDP
jgi:PleD family two-component response regulator